VPSGSQKSESGLFSSLYSYIASGGGKYICYIQHILSDSFIEQQSLFQNLFTFWKIFFCTTSSQNKITHFVFLIFFFLTLLNDNIYFLFNISKQNSF